MTSSNRRVQSSDDPTPSEAWTAKPSGVDCVVELCIIAASKGQSVERFPSSNDYRRGYSPGLRQEHRRGRVRERNYALHEDQFQEILGQLRLDLAVGYAAAPHSDLRVPLTRDGLTGSSRSAYAAPDCKVCDRVSYLGSDAIK
jgi:hypothetical protein